GDEITGSAPDERGRIAPLCGLLLSLEPLECDDSADRDDHNSRHRYRNARVHFFAFCRAALSAAFAISPLRSTAALDARMSGARTRSLSSRALSFPWGSLTPNRPQPD